MKRFVLDTCVIVSALRSTSGASYALLNLMEQGCYRPVISPALFLEYESVLKRSEQCRVTNLTIETIDGILTALAHFAIPTEINFTWRGQLPDANDDLVLDAAFNGSADALVTFNRADFVHVSRLFNIRVSLPKEAYLEIFQS